MEGAIRAFLRPTPRKQKSFADIRRIITAGEFGDQHAFIVGGSRGLGEVTAKMLAAGGARVVLTYFRGSEDAQDVANEIASAGGLAGAMQFNSLAARETLVDEEMMGELTHLYYLAISEFPKWRKYLISLSFRDKSSVRPVQVGGFEANIVVHRSTAVRGRGGPPPPWESSCRTRTGPVEADGTVDAPNAPTAPWKTLRVFHELPQGLSHRITHAKPRKAPKWRWETRIDPTISLRRRLSHPQVKTFRRSCLTLFAIIMAISGFPKGHKYHVSLYFTG